jgi:hypothetical protein
MVFPISQPGHALVYIRPKIHEIQVDVIAWVFRNNRRDRRFLIISVDSPGNVIVTYQLRLFCGSSGTCLCWGKVKSQVEAMNRELVEISNAILCTKIPKRQTYIRTITTAH